MEHSDDTEYKVVFINERIQQTIADLIELEYDGCITGSCVLEDDFSKWETEPDVDFFAYSEVSWIYAVSHILSMDRYKIGSKKDAWKLDRLKQGRHKAASKWITQTIYLQDTHTDVYINMSYKPGTSNILDVLGRFDTIAIMAGICCRTQTKVDLRGSFHHMQYPLPIEKDGYGNPIRLWYMAEGWDETTWGRELARIKKYDTRGFNMQGMAKDLIGVAVRVLKKGETIGSERSKARYLNLMLSCYRPVVWLEEFIGDPYASISDVIFSEVIKLTEDLPLEVQEKILNDLDEPFNPTGDKEFDPDDEEEEDFDEIPDDR